jgi:hypothetical protein
MPRYNHALTVAYQVETDEPEIPTLEECIEALIERLSELLGDETEAREALLSEFPFDTYEVDDA